MMTTSQRMKKKWRFRVLTKRMKKKPNPSVIWRRKFDFIVGRCQIKNHVLHVFDSWSIAVDLLMGWNYRKTITINMKAIEVKSLTLWSNDFFKENEESYFGLRHLTLTCVDMTFVIFKMKKIDPFIRCRGVNIWNTRRSFLYCYRFDKFSVNLTPVFIFLFFSILFFSVLSTYFLSCFTWWLSSCWLTKLTGVLNHLINFTWHPKCIYFGYFFSLLFIGWSET